MHAHWCAFKRPSTKCAAVHSLIASFALVHCFTRMRSLHRSACVRALRLVQSPHETLFLESTNDIRLRDISTSALVQFQLLDFPGHFDFDRKSSAVTPERIFTASSALVFVIDAQDDENQFSESIDYFSTMAKLAYQHNPRITFSVLIHKVDGDAYLSDDHKLECANEIKKSIGEDLLDGGLPIRPSYHLTSIYDHTIFEAFSKIVQSLIPQLPLLEKLLDGLIGSCGMEKSFLFDVVSKIYVATDSNPVDMQTYELCSDMIDVVIDVSCIYGLKPRDDQPLDGADAHAAAEAAEKALAGDAAESLAYDASSASVIKLSNNYILYLREVNKCLALVCLMRAECWQASGLVEYNFSCFRDAVEQLFQAKANSDALQAASLLKKQQAAVAAANRNQLSLGAGSAAAAGGGIPQQGGQQHK
jgi:Ras-related GTP-binding protein C/D